VRLGAALPCRSSSGEGGPPHHQKLRLNKGSLKFLSPLPLQGEAISAVLPPFAPLVLAAMAQGDASPPELVEGGGGRSKN
jgi:hypothetical protein